VKPAQRVLDSYGLMAYLEGEKGKETVIEVLKTARDSGQNAFLCLVNWGEVFYITLRETGQEKAEQVVRLLSNLPIELVPVDLELAKMAAILKAHKKMSYADCFAAALAKLKKAELVTGDKEFKEVEKEVKILWIS
jgi:predicted nucleic acid-binding protein